MKQGGNSVKSPWIVTLVGYMQISYLDDLLQKTWKHFLGHFLAVKNPKIFLVSMESASSGPTLVRELLG